MYLHRSVVEEGSCIKSSVIVLQGSCESLQDSGIPGSVQDESRLDNHPTSPSSHISPQPPATNPGPGWRSIPWRQPMPACQPASWQVTLSGAPSPPSDVPSAACGSRLPQTSSAIQVGVNVCCPAFLVHWAGMLRAEMSPSMPQVGRGGVLIPDDINAPSPETIITLESY
jgi:hypothetical protein